MEKATSKESPEMNEEEVAKKMQGYKKEYEKEVKRLLGLYVSPHNVKSRVVTTVDIPYIQKIGSDLLALCSLPRGKYLGGAVAHPQINDKDPLRFFVLPDGIIIINPLIVNHTKAHIFKTEGCLSFPDKEPLTMLPRYWKIEAEYQTLIEGKDKKLKLSPFTRVDLKGDTAQVFQHELQHLNGHNIYDEDSNPKQSIGLGDGILVDHTIWDKEGKNP